MAQALIEVTQWPSMPAPWSSTGPGEAWVWGDYVVLLQTDPITVAHFAGKLAGQRSLPNAPIAYPFAMTVFYRKDRNPHGPSSRPILVATLERADYAAAAKMMGIRGKDLPTSLQGKPPIVQGLFTAEKHVNLGHFKDYLTADTARKYFFNLVRKHLSLEGEPVRIGAMDDVHGHPNTGWPAQEKRKTKAKQAAGCLTVIASVLFLTTVAIWALAK